MNNVNQILAGLPVNDVSLYIEMGQEAIKHGDQDECLKWYAKGLSKARELRDKEKEREISNLIVTMI